MYSINFSKKKYDILILDDGQVDFKLQTYNFYIINFKSINFFVFIISLLKFLKSNKDKLSFKEIYKQNLYRHFKPKIIISHHLNNRSFEAKYLCPEIITMTYQFGFINEHARFLKNRPKKYCETDYFFVFHEIDKKILENLISRIDEVERNTAYLNDNQMQFIKEEVLGDAMGTLRNRMGVVENQIQELGGNITR